MKVGTLCFATDSGLGILAKAFYDHGIVTHPMVVRHGRHETHDHWYPGAPQLSDLRDVDRVKEFCRGVDLMLFFETPYIYELIPFCRSVGVKTIVSVMHECTHQRLLAAPPDLWLCPSQLDLDVFTKGAPNRTPFFWPQTGRDDQGLACFAPVPVDVPWRQRTKAEVFVHNAGWGGLKGRNGTKELLDAIKLVKSDARFIVRSQKSLLIGGYDIDAIADRMVSAVHGTTVSGLELWGDGDVFVFPERFNGLSLPLQEARASGMLVMATDRFPMNTWLPNKVKLRLKDQPMTRAESPAGMGGDYANPMILPDDFRRNRIGAPYLEFDEAIVNPKDIAEKIDEWYGRDITEYSLSGRQWAEDNSWAVLGPQYKKLLEELCNGP